MSFLLKDIEAILSADMVRKGLDYFSAGHVDRLDREENRSTATVRGAGNYEVVINFEGEQVTRWQCDCPYDKGPVCKHVVAVLFAIRTGWAEAELEKMKAYAKRDQRK